MKKKKILLVSVSNGIGGAELILCALARELAKDNLFRIDLLCSDVLLKSETVLDLKNSGAVEKLIPNRIRSRSKKNVIVILYELFVANLRSLSIARYDFVIFNNPQALFYLGILLNVLPFRPKTVLFNHNSYLPRSHVKFLKLFCRTDVSVHVSDAARDYYRGFDPGRKAYRIYNSIKPDFLFSQRSRKSVKTVFASISRISPEKGVHVLIRAFAILINSRKGLKNLVELHICGSADEGNLEYSEYLHSLVFELKLEESVRFCGVVNPYEKLSMASCLIVPSIIPDSLPTVIIEAFSKRCFVVGSLIGGIPELVDDGKTGYLCTPGDALSLSERMSDFLSIYESDECEHIIDSAYKFYSNKLSVDSFRLSWTNVLDMIG